MRSKVSLFLFSVVYNYLFLRVIVFPNFYSTYGKNIMPILFLVITSLLIFLVLIPTLDINMVKKSWIRYILSFSLVIRAIFLIGLTTIAFKKVFFQNENYLVLALGIIFTVVFLYLLESNEIMEIATPFGIVISLLYLFYFYGIRGFLSFDYNSIFTFDFNFIFLSLFYVIDNSILSFIPKNKKEKLTLGAASVTSSIIFLVEYLVLIESSGDVLFKNDYFSGFIPLAISSLSKYNYNFRYIYIAMLVITTAIKLSYYLSIIREINDISKKVSVILFSFVLAIGSLIMYLFYLKAFRASYMIAFISSFGYLLFYLWVIFNARRAKRNK